MIKYLTNDVYTESKIRIKYILDNFKKVYVSFSGGKDSGVMLNLIIDILRQDYPGRKIGIMILDNEANYTLSLEFMHRMMQNNRDVLDIYWCCLPITLPCTVSSYEIDWQCWGINDKHRWIREMPNQDYIVNINNHKFPFFRENMGYQEFWDEFGEWYSKGEDCACLIGIRTHESLNRWRAIVNENKQTHNGNLWTKKNTKHTYNCYPIYDWKTEDIWIANCKFEWDYNKLYDIFWKAGLSIHKMRVASPFMSESKSSLNLYRVIDPHVWATLCARVNGANFVATYGKQLNYHSFELPKGHTWKSFAKFLLNTLPTKSSINFKQRFIQSIKYWGRIGRGLPDYVINDLSKNNIEFKLNGNTSHGNKDKQRVIIQSLPDHLDMLKCHNSDVASWKRFVITILKNDHTCKYLGLAQTKEQIERMKYIKNKYSKI
jgi:predicted phosphoadenosine phosphosulfate sulfurtransferase